MRRHAGLDKVCMMEHQVIVASSSLRRCHAPPYPKPAVVRATSVVLDVSGYRVTSQMPGDVVPSVACRTGNLLCCFEQLVGHRQERGGEYHAGFKPGEERVGAGVGREVQPALSHSSVFSVVDTFMIMKV